MKTRVLLGVLLLAGIVQGAGQSQPDSYYTDLCQKGIVSACYKLRADSIYRGRGTDGKDLGADIDTLILVEQCAVSGDGSSLACQKLLNAPAVPSGVIIRE